MLIRIEAPHFVAGIIYNESWTSECAPIVSYMRDWNLNEIEGYCKKKGWKFKILDTAPSDGQRGEA